MRLKYFNRTIIVYNMLIYICFSVLLLCSTKMLSEGKAFYDILNFKIFLSNNTYLLFASSFLALCIYFISKWSSVFFMIFFLFVFGNIFYFFILADNKLVLTASFLYLIFSFCLWLLWKDELKDVVYHPAYSFFDMDDPYIVKIKSKMSDNEGENYLGFLTNWSEQGCFIHLKNINLIKRNKVAVEIYFEGIKFSATGVIVSSYFRGVGVKLNNSNEVRDSWKGFYSIIESRGYKPMLQRN